MINKELMTSYIYKHTSGIILPASLLFICLTFNLYFKRKEKEIMNQ